MHFMDEASSVVTAEQLCPVIARQMSSIAGQHFFERKHSQVKKKKLILEGHMQTLLIYFESLRIFVALI